MKKKYKVAYIQSFAWDSDSFETVVAEDIVEARKIAEEHGRKMNRSVTYVREIIQ